MKYNCDNCRNFNGKDCKYRGQCLTGIYDGETEDRVPSLWVSAIELDEPILTWKGDKPMTITFDNVNAPSHYCEGRKYEPIKVIQDWKLDFCLGNTVKYISRAGRKSSGTLDDHQKELEDLKKARFYLDYKIKELEEEYGQN